MASGDARPAALPGTLVVGAGVVVVLDALDTVVLDPVEEEVEEEPEEVGVDDAEESVEVTVGLVTDVAELGEEAVLEAEDSALTAAVAPMTWNGPA